MLSSVHQPDVPTITTPSLPSVVYIGAPEGFAALEEVVSGHARIIHPKAETAALTTALADAHALLDASMRVPITGDLIAAAPELKIISCATTGADHIALDATSKRGIVLRTLKEDGDLIHNITPAAELSWTLLLACARKLTGAVAHTREGRWERELFPGIMLRGRQLGLVGCGRIGQWMSRYAEAFGVSAVGYDPYADPWPASIRSMDLEELFASSDFISVHVHLTDETRGLVSRSLLERVKPGAIFINTSRGAIADESAVLDLLTSGRLAAAGLDVLEGEPNVADHPLVAYARTHDNLLITPHCGGFSPDAVRLVCRRAAEKIAAHLGLNEEGAA